MPRGVPRLGADVGASPAKTDSIREELAGAPPQPEVLGEIKFKPPKASINLLPDDLDPEIKHLIEIEEGPAPWEAKGEDSGNARNFVECPPDWVLYWINPKLLDAAGWRGWTHVRSKDPRVKVLVPSMVDPTGMIRRGGGTGDILAYMPRHWYESRKREYEARVQAGTQSSVEKMESLKEEFKRGRFGPYIQLESATHPTHTIADLKGAND